MGTPIRLETYCWRRTTVEGSGSAPTICVCAAAGQEPTLRQPCCTRLRPLQAPLHGCCAVLRAVGARQVWRTLGQGVGAARARGCPAAAAVAGRLRRRALRAYAGAAESQTVAWYLAPDLFCCDMRVWFFVGSVLEQFTSDSCTCCWTGKPLLLDSLYFPRMRRSHWRSALGTLAASMPHTLPILARKSCAGSPCSCSACC